jgi:hypothetical protein
MKLTAPTLTAAFTTLAVAAAPAGAQEERHLGNMRITDVAALGERVFAVAHPTSRTWAIAEVRDGGHSWLKIPTSRHAYVPDVGTDRRGNTVVVYSRADRRGDHDLYVYDLQTQRERKLAGSARGTDERFPSIWLGEVVFFRSGAGEKRNGIYRRAAFGPARGKEILVWNTSVARATDMEDDEVVFETDVKAGIHGKANAIYVIRENSPRPRLAAATHTDDDGNRTVVSSPSISGGYLTYLRHDSKYEPRHAVYRQLVDGTATDTRRTARPEDATELAVGGPRLFFTRSIERGLHEIRAPEWLGPRG